MHKQMFAGGLVILALIAGLGLILYAIGLVLGLPRPAVLQVLGAYAVVAPAVAGYGAWKGLHGGTVKVRARQ